MITLIDDLRHKHQCRRHRTAVAGAGQGDPRAAAAAADRARTRRNLRRASTSCALEIADYLDILRLRARVQSHRQDRRCRDQDQSSPPAKPSSSSRRARSIFNDLIQREEMVVTVSHAGYTKRVPLSAYRAQRRGGKGRSGMQTREEDFVSRLFVASTHTPVQVLPLARPGLQGKSLAIAGRSAQRPRQGADQYPAAGSRASASPPSCRCRRMNPPGPTST